MIQHFSSNTFKIFFFFSVFTDVPSSAWQQAVHFGARRSSNLTRSSHVRLPLVPCLAEVRPPLPAKVKHFALLLQLSFKLLLMDPRLSFSSCCGEAAGSLPRHGGGAWSRPPFDLFTIIRNHPRLTPPLGGAERQRTNRIGVGILIEKKKVPKKNVILSPRRKRKIRALTVQAILKVIIWWFSPSPSQPWAKTPAVGVLPPHGGLVATTDNMAWSPGASSTLVCAELWPFFCPFLPLPNH